LNFLFYFYFFVLFRTTLLLDSHDKPIADLAQLLVTPEGKVTVDPGEDFRDEVRPSFSLSFFQKNEREISWLKSPRVS